MKYILLYRTILIPTWYFYAFVSYGERKKWLKFYKIKTIIIPNVNRAVDLLNVLVNSDIDFKYATSIYNDIKTWYTII
jgi:hypothetical protein